MQHNQLAYEWDIGGCWDSADADIFNTFSTVQFKSEKSAQGRYSKLYNVGFLFWFLSDMHITS